MNLFNTRDVEGNEHANDYGYESSASSSDSYNYRMTDEPTLPSSTPQSEPSPNIEGSQADAAPASHLQSKINQAYMQGFVIDG